MGNLRRWSSSASGNATVTGGSNTINFAEGQNPSTVNNSAREMMAQIRGIYSPSEWGWVEFSATASVASQTSFKLTGNQTGDWTAGRRWRLKSGSSTRYGAVVSSSFTSETTVTVTVDSGSLSASHSLAALAVIDSNHVPVNSYVTSNSASAMIAAQISGATIGTSQIAANAVDGTKIALGSDAQGDIMYYDGTNWVRLAAGTSGQYLKTNGAGANPAWETLSTSVRTLLGTLTTTSGNSQTLPDLTLTSYRKLYFHIKGISGSNSSGQFSIDGLPFHVSWGSTTTNTVSGYMEIDLLTGVFISYSHLTGSTGTTHLDGKTTISNASTSITVTYGFTMDAGSIDVYGVV